MTVQTGGYDEFFGHYQPFVAAYVARRVQRDAVEDLVAEVFTVAWRRRDIVPDNALPWLYRTARNLIGNQYRSRDRLAALQEKLRSVPTETTADSADIAERRARLVDAFSSLSDDDRELLLLVAWEGLDSHDLAAALNLSPGAASVRLHRARARFETKLGVAIDEHDELATDITKPTTRKGARE